MKINMIVATSMNNVIGKDNSLPWYIPEDLKYFKEKTLNKTIVMGRKTFESIGKVLPNRTTIILTHDKNFKFNHPNILIYNNIEDILIDFKDEELWIVGGSQIYKLFYPYTTHLYITLIYKKVYGDSYFLEYKNDFRLSNTTTVQTSSGYPYQFTQWERVQNNK